jgi:hypothetical protein
LLGKSKKWVVVLGDASTHRADPDAEPGFDSGALLLIGVLLIGVLLIGVANGGHYN